METRNFGRFIPCKRLYGLAGFDWTRPSHFPQGSKPIAPGYEGGNAIEIVPDE